MVKLYETSGYIFAVVERADKLIIVPDIECTSPDDEAELIKAARNGFSKPHHSFGKWHYWGDVSRIPDDYFGYLPAAVIAAGLEEKAELIAEIDEESFILYRDDLGEAGKKLFERCSEIEYGYRCPGAENLYDGGWRASDRDDLACEYGLDDEYLDWLCEGLQDIEDKDAEDDEENDEE